MSTITVLGSASIDLVVEQPRVPRAGETIFGHTFTTVPGGKGLNQAIAAARAGGDVRFLGAVGDDDFGIRVRVCLRDAGVDTAGLRTVAGPTGTAHIAVLEGGENAITIVPAANSSIKTFDPEAEAMLRGSRFLISQFERPIPLIREAFAAARAEGIRTVLTPAPVLEADSELLSLVDILVPNAMEACNLACIEDERQAAIALSHRVGLVVMTRGEHGAMVVRDGSIEFEVPARIVDVVDTTAAGDTFVGALVTWLDEGAPLELALRAATAAASLCVTRLGTSSAIPFRSEIDALL